tara:strand:+ start:756 stop:1979 length:1224 start_codon:yes stop_codon:yes gene_type:complete
MISFKKSVNQASFIFIICCIVFRPEVTTGEVFDRVVAKVNSEIITMSLLDERAIALRHKFRKETVEFNEKEVLREALEMIINEKLQLQQAKKMGFEVDNSSVEAALKNIERQNGLQEGQLEQMLDAEGASIETYKERIRDQIIVSKVKNFELGSRLNVSDKRIVKYYHDHQKDFWESGKSKVRHILILFEKESSVKKKQEKYRKIKKILSQLESGKDFSEAAKIYSEDVSASSGGDLGFVEKGQMVPEFEKTVYSLKEGEISGIVETDYGFHIIKVDEVRKGRTIPLNTVRNKIKGILAGKKEKTVYENWMKELKDSSFIEISLFKEPKKNLSSALFNVKNKGEKPSDLETSEDMQKKKNRRLVDKAERMKMQNMWEKMYKSVEKSRTRNSAKTKSSRNNRENAEGN